MIMNKILLVLAALLLCTFAYAQKVRKIYYADTEHRYETRSPDKVSGENVSYITKLMHKDEIEEIYWDEKLTVLRSRTKRKNNKWYHHVSYFRDGRLAVETTYDTILDEFTYPSVWHYMNGTVEKEIKKEKDTVFHREYKETGALVKEFAFGMKASTGVNTGIVQTKRQMLRAKVYYDNKFLSSVTHYTYRSDTAIASIVNYYPDGKIQSSYKKLSGYNIGTYLEYHRNGQLKMKTEYKEEILRWGQEGQSRSILHGRSETYDENGKLISSVRYENGKMIK
jgi:antitoxin component YwqK of YwqJK toxin-antitoxin module